MRPSECVVLHFILFQRNGFWEMPFLWLTLTQDGAMVPFAMLSGSYGSYWPHYVHYVNSDQC